MQYSLQTAPNEAAFVTQSVDWLATTITKAIQANGECIIGLSGGSTPAPVYTALAKTEAIDWQKVTFFLLDDRMVSKDHADSNQKLIQDTLLSTNIITLDQCVFPDTNGTYEYAVAQYTRALTALFASNPPDLLILGMGEDGHIASLFPPVQESSFGEKLVVHTQTEKFSIKDRISVSPLVLLAAKKSLLLLKGANKKAVFMECVQAAPDPVRWPLHIPLSKEAMTVILQT